MKLRKSRKQQINELAKYIATEDYNYGLPIDLAKIAEDNEITFNLDDYDKYFDGMLEHENGNFHIFINNYGQYDINTPRIRFSFAHELGHYFIDEHRHVLESGKSLHHPSQYKLLQKDPIEEEADYFASCLLMPENLFYEHSGGQFSYSKIESLQKLFRTSISATLIRYIDLGDTPIMMVCAKEGIIKYNWCSEDFPYKFIKKDYTKKVPLLTCAGDYFANNVVCNDMELVDSKEWFSSYDDLTGIEVNEKCLYFDKYKMTISILWFD